MTMQDIKQSRKLPVTSPRARDSLCKVTTISLRFKFMHPVSHGVSALADQFLLQNPPGLKHQQQVPCTGHRAELGPRDSQGSCNPGMSKLHCSRRGWLQGFPQGREGRSLQLGIAGMG